jgi:wyosine [tRNA(Phe)-imidazoG37] synthetase (radical SAM superfamily)
LCGGKKTAEESKYLFGPVPSRRLGRSLGVDIVPFKVCTLDCVYCQLGKTSKKSVERRDYVPVEVVLAQLKEKLAQSIEVDYITISGSGEPTLNSQLGVLVDGIKKISDIPVAILTNGTLFYREDVRADCCCADLVVPSLDAGDEQTFQKINRPHKDISIEKLISGLCAFREEFSGRIWLEIFVVERLNTDSEQMAKIKEIIDRIHPDKVQLNTAVRPTAERQIKKVTSDKLRNIAAQFGSDCEVVADFSTSRHYGYTKFSRTGKAFGAYLADDLVIETLLSMLKRRPCSVDDICVALKLKRNEAIKYVYDLQKQGVISSEDKEGIVFFKAS